MIISSGGTRSRRPFLPHLGLRRHVGLALLLPRRQLLLALLQRGARLLHRLLLGRQGFGGLARGGHLPAQLLLHRRQVRLLGIQRLRQRPEPAQR